MEGNVFGNWTEFQPKIGSRKNLIDQCLSSFSALDAESEHWVKEALDKLMVGRTVITIAHRLSTIKTADQIAVLDAGKVVELGSYRDLIQIENGMFKRLVEKQTITT